MVLRSEFGGKGLVERGEVGEVGKEIGAEEDGVFGHW